MIITVDQTTVHQAGWIHALSWQESHRSFCSPAFVALHTPERQTAYLADKLARGTLICMLLDPEPVGIVSVTGSLIEDLYILPQHQRKGYGTALLLHAMKQCQGVPSLWILQNNTGAARLYTRHGFVPSGKRNRITDKIDEIEYVFHPGHP